MKKINGARIQPQQERMLLGKHGGGKEKMGIGKNLGTEENRKENILNEGLENSEVRIALA